MDGGAARDESVGCGGGQRVCRRDLLGNGTHGSHVDRSAAVARADAVDENVRKRVDVVALQAASGDGRVSSLSRDGERAGRGSPGTVL
jgi:hypothetical protein